MGVKLRLLNGRREECKIDADLLRSNNVEFDAIRNYLVSKKMTSKDVFDQVLKDIEKKNFAYIIDRKIMRIPPVSTR